MTLKNKTMVRQAHHDVKPIYVIAGEDAFLVKNECERLLDEIIAPEERTTGLLRVEGRNISITSVLDELRTLPFLGERRVAVIENADKTILKKPSDEEEGGESDENADDAVSKNREILERYFDKPSASGVLILTVSSWPSNTRLAKKLSQYGQLIEVGKLSSKSLISYIQNYARQQHNKEVSYNAAQMLAEFVGDEPGMLCGEVDKLAAYVSSAKIITEKDIAAVCGHNRMFDAFDVINLMSAGQAGKALERLRLMFQSDKTAEYTIVGAFAWHFRRMFSAAAMLKNGQPAQIVARNLRIWNSDEFFGTLKKMPLEKIGDCLKKLCEFDYAIKTGRATAETAIETMVVELAGNN